jgi:hypothetical protein
MNGSLFQIAASVAVGALGVALLAAPEMAQSLFPIEAPADRHFAVRLLGAGLVCAVFLAWSIKDFIEA